MNDRITVHLQRTLQVVDYAPILYAATHETSVQDGETIQRARTRCHAEATRTFNSVQEEIIATFQPGNVPALPMARFDNTPQTPKTPTKKSPKKIRRKE